MFVSNIAIVELRNLVKNPSDAVVKTIDDALLTLLEGDKNLAKIMATTVVTSEQWEKISELCMAFDAFDFCADGPNYKHSEGWYQNRPCRFCEEGYNDDEIWWDERDE